MFLKIRDNNDGQFCYPLDDAFIHLSVAKHFVLDGVWGITSEEYGAASSSPFYTLLLAICIRFGFTSLLLPLWLNIGFSLALLIIVSRHLKHNGLSQLSTFFILQGIIWFTPLFAMALIGMEHILHLLFTVVLIRYAVHFCSSQTNWKKIIYLGFIAGLAILVRLESIFIVAAICLLFIYQKKLKKSLLFGLTGMIPLVIAGVWSMMYGGHFLPNSILIKAIVDDGSFLQSLAKGELPAFLYFDSFQAPFRLVISGIIILLLLWQFRFKGSVSHKVGWALFIWLITCILHLLNARVGWLYRYEAWLIGSCIFVFGLVFGLQYRCKSFGLQKYHLLITLCLLLFFTCAFAPLVKRAKKAGSDTIMASTNIYEQQFQMARFLTQYYDHEPIAANDVGAISFYGNNYIVDLWGLGNNEVALSKLKKKYTVGFLDSLCVEKGIKIAVIYDSWFPAELRNKWLKVGSWRIFNNIICGDSNVSFYVTVPSAAPSLKKIYRALSRTFLKM